MESKKKVQSTPRVIQIWTTVILLALTVALFVPGIDYIGYSWYVYSFFDNTPAPAVISILMMIGGIISVWCNTPKLLMVFSSMFLIDEIIYISAIGSYGAEGGFYLFTFLVIVMLIICILAIKNTVEIDSPIQSTQVPAIKVTAADTLAEYKKLLDSGALTQEEYEEKKTKLLNL